MRFATLLKYTIPRDLTLMIQCDQHSKWKLLRELRYTEKIERGSTCMEENNFDILKKFEEELPASWKKQFKSDRLRALVADQGMWFGRPQPTSKEGRQILKLNEPLFRFCESLDDMEYAFEPVDEMLFEMIPREVRRQGVGISVDLLHNALEIDLYLFPCDYSEDEKRNLPFLYLRVPVVSVGSVEVVEAFVRKYFLGERQSAAIPFSLDRVAELNGNFMDDYKKTEKICRKAVLGGTAQEIKNCEAFLDFVRTAGF